MAKEESGPKTSEDDEKIEILKTVIVRHNLKFEIAKTRKVLPDPYVRIQITLLLNQISFIIPSWDEYKDADTGHPVLLFHLALVECDEYQEATDYIDWAKTAGLNQSEPAVEQAYAELKDNVPKLLEIIGPDVKPLPDFDFEMNMGTAYKLRNELKWMRLFEGGTTEKSPCKTKAIY